MKTILFGGFLCLAATAFGGTISPKAAPASRISVNFINPASFKDIGPNRSREVLLRDLGDAMQKAAIQSLRKDLRLDLKVTNVDLAGDFEPWRGMDFSEVRVMRDVYPPRMTIEYRLSDPHGKVLTQGEAKLSNTEYLRNSRFESDPLRHDKALFRDWFSQKFAGYRK